MAIATSTALALAGLAASGAAAYNTKRTGDKQDGIAAQGIRNQAANQRKVTAGVNETLDKTAESTAEGSQKAANDRYLTHIRNQMATGTAGLAKRGASDKFNQMAGDASGEAVDYATMVAGLLSRIDGGNLQRQDEANLMGDFSMDANRIGGDIQGDAFLNGLALKGVRRNPYIDIAAGALKGYSASGGTGGSGGDWSGTSPISGVNTAGSATGWQGNSAFGAYGAGWNG